MSPLPSSVQPVWVMTSDSRAIEIVVTEVEGQLSDSATSATRDWEIIEPVNEDHLALAETVGPKIGRKIHGPAMHYVTGGQTDEDGNLWVSSYYGQIHRMNSALEIDYTPNIPYQAPAVGGGIAYLQDMSITTDGSKLILAVSYAHHCVKVYERDTSLRISTIGVPNGSGSPSDGRLWNPHSAVRLGNGNIAVTSYNGFGPNAGNHGTITEWDITTQVATLVATRLEFSGNGISAVGTNKIYRPMRMILDADQAHVWVSEYGRGRILKVDTSTWLTADILNTPSGIGSIGGSYGLAQMQDGTIVVAANSGKEIIGIDPTTKAAVFTIDPTEFGSSNNGMRGVFPIGDKLVAWADWSTQLIYVATTIPVSVPYSIPVLTDGWEIVSDSIPSFMNPATFIASINSAKLTLSSGTVPILKRKST